MSTGQHKFSLSLSLKIDSGTYVRDFRHPPGMTEGRILFSRRFESVPTVIVSLQSVDASNRVNLRVRVFATHVNLAGFTVRAESWADTEIYSCGVTWLAIGH
ncbi:hypothetical protein BGX38DRAFT_1219495 [Terfezia claveryi]|nr:hypothetical protein BGX38DRAFT_1219495 [Terfezia claveryi]